MIQYSDVYLKNYDKSGKLITDGVEIPKKCKKKIVCKVRNDKGYITNTILHKSNKDNTKYVIQKQ